MLVGCLRGGICCEVQVARVQHLCSVVNLLDHVMCHSTCFIWSETGCKRSMDVVLCPLLKGIMRVVFAVLASSLWSTMVMVRRQRSPEAHHVEGGKNFEFW